MVLGGAPYCYELYHVFPVDHKPERTAQLGTLHKIYFTNAPTVADSLENTEHSGFEATRRQYEKKKIFTDRVCFALRVFPYTYVHIIAQKLKRLDLGVFQIFSSASLHTTTQYKFKVKVLTNQFQPKMLIMRSLSMLNQSVNNNILCNHAW